ncbi:MAG TPA: SDR family NAD(P)-dependent oxidoreductase [Bryobacteraceae bacterium]|nr:SDR family NAD(P)-dependent oxidoreductase [Bryobacteraceae bacterium]
MTNSDTNLHGSVVCVTGASRGIGEAVARAFAERGCRLVLLARSGDVLDVASQVSGSTEAVGQCVDVADYAAVQQAISSCVGRWGRIDVLVNAAAILGPTGEIWTTEPGAWTATLEANLVGTYHTMRAALPFMIEARRGKIINFAGGGAAYGYPRFSAYAASKVAVVRLTETVAMETAQHNVQANVIAPGAIETKMLQAVRAAGGEVRSAGTMDQPVELVMYLASSASDHISGRFIHAKDDYQQWTSLSEDLYTLRRVQQ